MAVENSKGCLVCYSLNNNKGSEVEDPEKILQICLSYLHSVIGKKNSGNVQFKDGTGIRLCENCFDTTMELTQLNEQLTNLQKQISDVTIAFSLAVLHRRSQTYDGQKSKQNAMLTRQNTRIIQLDVSDFSANMFPSNSLPAENNIEDTQNLRETVHFQRTESIQECVNLNGSNAPPNIRQNTPNIFQDPNTGAIRETNNVEASFSGNLLNNRCNVEEHNVVTREHTESLQKTHDTPNLNQNTPNILEEAAKTQETLNTRDFRAVDDVEGSVSRNLMTTNGSIKVEKDNLVTNVLVEENQSNHVAPSESSAVNPTNNEATSEILKTVRMPTILIQRISMGAIKRAQINKTAKSENAPGSFNRNPRNLRPRTAQQNENTSGRVSYISKKNEHSIVGSRQSRMKKIMQNSRRHAERTRTTGIFKCNKCPRVFPSKIKLTIHLRFHDGKGVYQCSFCTNVFAFRSLCTTHEASHSQEKLFQCQMCNKRFKSVYTLKKHEKIHSGDHHCSYCESSFSELLYLRSHERIHTGGLFKCTTCGELYAHLSSLRCHERIHTGQLFKCTTCGKSYTRKNVLRYHERVHAS